MKYTLCRKACGFTMSRVMRRTPYDRVRFSFRAIGRTPDVTNYGYVAVVPCEKCAPQKVQVCQMCRVATRKEIDAYWGKMSEMMWNLGEDFVVKPKYNEEKGEWEDDWTANLPFETP